MTRGRKRLEFSQSRRAQIFELICDHAEASRTLPVKHVIYWSIVEPALGISPTTFYHHFDRLVEEGFLTWDSHTGEVSVVHSDLTVHDPAVKKIVKMRI